VLRGLAGSRLGIQIDGECIFGGCGNRMDPPTAYVFPAAYDRITVIKGPQTVLHGPGNSAGRRPLRARSPAARAAASPRSSPPPPCRQLRPVRPRRGRPHRRRPEVQARLTATSTRADDYADGCGRDVHSAYDRWSANASAAWTPDDRTVVEFATARSDGEAAYADRTMDGVKFDRENYGLRFKPHGPEPARRGGRSAGLLQLRRPRDGQLQPPAVRPLDDDARPRRLESRPSHHRRAWASWC
jgi:iron complex outermembrane receptor protein